MEIEDCRVSNNNSSRSRRRHLSPTFPLERRLASIDLTKQLGKRGDQVKNIREFLSSILIHEPKNFKKREIIHPHSTTTSTNKNVWAGREKYTKPSELSSLQKVKGSRKISLGNFDGGGDHSGIGSTDTLIGAASLDRVTSNEQAKVSIESNLQLNSRQSFGSGSILPPQPEYIKEFYKRPADTAESRLLRFRKILNTDSSKKLSEKNLLKAVKQDLNNRPPLFQAKPNLIKPRQYSASLKSILGAKEFDKLIPDQTADMLYKKMIQKDREIRNQLARVQRLKSQLINREINFPELIINSEATQISSRIKLRNIKRKRSSVNSHVVFGTTFRKERCPSTIFATIGSKTSTESNNSNSNCSLFHPHPCKKERNLTKASSSGYVAGISSNDEDDDEDDNNNDNNKIDKYEEESYNAFISKYIGARRSQIVSSTSGLKSKTELTVGEINEIRREVLKIRKSKEKSKKKKKIELKKKLKFIKEPTEIIYSSSTNSTPNEVIRKWKKKLSICASDDKKFIDELKKSVYINPGHCSLTLVSNNEDNDEMFKPKSKLHRYFPLGKLAGSAKNDEYYEELSKIFPRKSVVTVSDPMDPRFWENFHVNRQSLESVLGKNAILHKSWIYDLLGLDRYENADPYDSDPSIAYYYKRLSSLENSDDDDEDEDEQIPKILKNVNSKSFRTLNPTNSLTATGNKEKYDDDNTNSSSDDDKSIKFIKKPKKLRSNSRPMKITLQLNKIESEEVVSSNSNLAESTKIKQKPVEIVSTSVSTVNLTKPNLLSAVETSVIISEREGRILSPKKKAALQILANKSADVEYLERKPVNKRIQKLFDTSSSDWFQPQPDSEAVASWKAKKYGTIMTTV